VLHAPPTHLTLLELITPVIFGEEYIQTLEAPHNEFLSSLLFLHPSQVQNPNFKHHECVFSLSHDGPSFMPMYNERRDYNFVYVRLSVLDSK